MADRINFPVDNAFGDDDEERRRREEEKRRKMEALQNISGQQYDDTMKEISIRKKKKGGSIEDMIKRAWQR